VPGYAFQLEVLRQVQVELRRGESADASLLNSPFARLGAFGPDLLVYAPPIDTLAAGLKGGTIVTLLGEDIRTLNATDLRTLEDLYEKPVGAAYSALFSNLVLDQVWSDLVTVIQFLQQASSIAQSQDSSQLKSFFAEFPDIKTKLTNLSTKLGPGLKTLLSLSALIVGGPWMEVAPALAQVLLLLPAASPKGCRPYEYLRWHRSGEFAQALWSNAQTNNQKAFALGWMSHIAASVTGEPFINNIVGGPYRTHWWRNRLASNFVDAWTFGFFEETSNGQGFPSIDGNVPTPPYQDWAPLYGANLQNEFDVGDLAHSVTAGIPDAVTAMGQGVSTTRSPNLLSQLSGQFPAEITNLIAAALEQAYPASVQTDLPMPPSLTAGAFADAYVGAFSVYWFMTSGEGPLGNNILGPPPSTACGTTPPSWATSASSNAPAPQQGSVVNQSGSAVCAAVLAILAALAFLTDNIAAGVALTIAAVEEVPSDSINWPQVQCDLWWLESLVDKALNALRDGLWILTFAYPPPVMLGSQDPDGNWIPATDWTDLSAGEDPPAQLPNNEPPASGVPLTMTNAFSAGNRDVPGRYPHGLDTGPDASGNAIIPDFDYFRFPGNAPLETDSNEYPARDLVAPGMYPNTIVSGLGLTNDGMLQPTTFPTRNVSFGDAVSNALAVIEAKAAGLPDYNLDGDRGYGWLGWRPEPLSKPATPPVKVEADA
jgi:hypothetical protein